MTKTNITIFGKNGQVASSLIKIFKAEPDFSITTYSSQEVDFANQLALQTFLQNHPPPDFIINTSAYTNVDQAEDERQLADLINHQAIKIIANYCQKNNTKLIHYSTDYVFDGSGTQPFAEDNTKNLNPINYYGTTKLAGERAILKSGCHYIIIRLSWVYDRNPDHKNFFNTIKKLAREKEVLNIISDQIGSPTTADFVASNTIKIIKKIDNNFYSIIYHLNNGEFLSWYDFAIKIIDELKKNGKIIKVQQINPIKSSQYQTKASRPLNSRLLNQKLQNLITTNHSILEDI
jgi:dTDP-4-dehydrorhamnose reductase